MNNLTNFKEFVKKHPSLLKYVNSGEMNWQKFYEMYDMYGEENDVWNKYFTVATQTESSVDFMNWLKNINVESLQENINSVKRVIGVLQELGLGNKNTSTYKPRPIYRHFED